MENLWKEVFLVGTEWAQYEDVHKQNWDFSSLEEAFEAGGVLHEKTCWLFGSTEGQYSQVLEKAFLIPVIFAVVSPLAPSYKLGVKSVQMENEEIIDMNEMKFGWIPYFDEETAWRKPAERSEVKIHVLKCKQRRTTLKRMKEEQVKKFEYLLPYVFNPEKEGDPPADSVVQIMYTYDEEKPPIVTDYDWKMDDKEDFLERISEETELPEAELEKFWAHCKDKANAAKANIREARAERKRMIDSMPEAERESLRVMKVYKFYPKETAETPEVLKWEVKYVNRYFGNADEVFPPLVPEVPFSWGAGKVTEAT